MTNKLLITGGLGYIGSFTAKKFLKKQDLKLYQLATYLEEINFLQNILLIKN